MNRKLFQIPQYSFFIYCLALYFLLAPFDFIPVIPGVSVSKIMILLPIIGAILEKDRFNFRFLNKDICILLIFLLINIVSILYSIDMHNTIQRVITLGSNIIIITIISAGKIREKELEFLLKIYALSGLILFFITIMGYGMGARLSITLGGIEQDPNYMCGYFIFPLIYFFYNYFKLGKKKYIILAFIMIVVPVLSGSRGGILAGSVSIIMLLSSKEIRDKICSRKNFIKILVGVVIIILLFNVLWDYIPNDIKIRYTLEFTIQDRGANRFDIWEDLMYKYNNSSMFNRLFGFGPATTVLISSYNHVAHNIYIETLVELGIIGIFIMIYMYLFFLKKGRKNNIVLFSSLVGYLIMCMSMSLYSYRPIWNVILLIILSNRVGKKYI